MRRRFAATIVLISLLATAGVPPQTLPERAEAAATQSGRRVLGYYVNYDPTSWSSLETQAPLIDVVAAQWVTLDACGQLTSRDDQTLKQFARSRGIQVFPSLLTLSGWLNHQLLTDEETTARAISEIVDYVVAEDYDGFDLDLEGVWPDDRPAYTAFVARLGAALHARDKALSLALPAKTSDTTSGWGGAFDYAALGPHADLITIMAYEYSGSWGKPGPIAPYDWVEQVTAFAASQIPPEKVLLGLASYGHDWNTTSGGGRYLGFAEAEALSDWHGIPLILDPATHSETMRYRVPAGERPPRPMVPPAPQHLITQRQAPPCAVAPPPTATPTPRPTPPPDAIQDHEVWVEGTASTAARLPLVDHYGIAGIASWRLGHESPSVWPVVDRWRQGAP
jgi:spore germination protein